MQIGPLCDFPAPPVPSPRNSLSTAFAIASALLCIAGLIYALVSWLNVPTVFPSEAANDQRKKGLDLRIELSAKLFDLGLLMLGVLWAFVLAEKVTIRFSRWQEAVLFISSNLLLLISLLFHLLYRLRLANMLWDLAVPPPPLAEPRLPDIRSNYVEFPFRVQWLLFFGSLFSGFCTILVVKVLGGPR